MSDFYTHAFSDNIRLARSKPLIAVDDGTYNVIRVPRFAFVKGIWVDVKEAYDGGSPTVTVGFIGNNETADPDGFMVSSAVTLTAKGVTASIGGTAVWADGKYFRDSAGAITVTVSNGGATTKGTLLVLADYSVIH